MKVPWMVVAFVIVLVGFGVAQTLSLRRAEALLAAVEQGRGDLKRELAATRQKLGEANQRVLEGELKNTAMRDDLGQLFSTKSSAALNIVTQQKAQARFGGWSVRPPVQAPRRHASVEVLDSTYHALYRRLKFTPAQIVQFKALAREDAQRFADLDALASSRSLHPTAPELMQRYQQAEAEFKARVTEHFGADTIPVIQHFSETLFLRDAPAYVVGRLFWSDTPVTEAQADQLVEILWRNLQDGYGRANHAFANPTAMVREADSVLTPSQLPVWREYVEHLTRTSFSSIRPPRR